MFKIETRIKMLVSGVAEHLVVFLMKEAGIPIENTQKRVKVRIEESDLDMSGSIDYTLDGGVRDFKCTNDESYKQKFRGGPTLAENDPFGYLAQGNLYARGMGMKFKGWDVFNLNTGDIKAISAGSIQNEMEEQIDFFQHKLEIAREAKDVNELEQCYEMQDNGTIAWQCARCNFVKQCFPEAENIGEPGKPRYLPNTLDKSQGDTNPRYLPKGKKK